MVFVCFIGQINPVGTPPGANEEVKPKQEEGRESARPSRPAVSPAEQIDNNFLSPLSEAFTLFLLYFFGGFFTIHALLSLSVSAPLSLSYLQSYKKAIDEVSGNRVPLYFIFFLFSRLSLAQIVRPPLPPLAW